MSRTDRLLQTIVIALVVANMVLMFPPIQRRIRKCPACPREHVEQVPIRFTESPPGVYRAGLTYDGKTCARRAYVNDVEVPGPWNPLPELAWQWPRGQGCP